MHDAVIGERLGLPSVGIVTTAFVSAAELMARVLGAGDYRFAVIDHPLSSATPAELSTRARYAASMSDAILRGVSMGQEKLR